MNGTYRLVEENNVWLITENGKPIAKSRNKQHALGMLNHLNWGGAFEGKTPPFMFTGGPIDIDRRKEDAKPLR